MAYTTINKSSLHMNTKLYTGTGSSNSVTGVGFQPDMTWFKHRNGTSEHNIYDAVRGATKRIIPNDSSAEGTQSNGLSAFGSDGFTVVDSNATNLNNGTYASWNWKANGAGSANTDGSISSTVSANTTAGFSIVTYTGTGANATVGHGLNAVPKMIIVKRRDANDSWWTFNSNLGSNDAYLALQSTAASSTAGGNTLWNSTAPTSSVFSVGTNSGVNGSSSTYVAYCFAEKKGYSKIGSYTGNGSSSSPTFIYTGFKPKFVMVKNISQADSWFIHDDKRDGYNDDNEYLFADLSNAEGTNVNRIRFLSNGFSVPTIDKSHNVSGNSYIYMAFGQSLVGSNNVPCTAR